MNTTIFVEHLSKTYRLGQIGTGTFTHDLSTWWAKVRGKPNPMLKIGEKDHGNRYNEEIWALKDVSFKVDQGEVLGVIGRNGAGKSTLLKILSRVTAPTSGRVKIKGRIASLLEVGTGFHPELTGRENIYLNGAILGMTRKEIDRNFDEILNFSEVEKFIDTPVKRYSSGMYVRLAFAVAAHLEPEILVVDEVLAVGDAEFQKKCLGKMGDIAREGRTVLFVSHNLGAVNNLCSKCIWLDRGQVKHIGNTNDTITKYLQVNADNQIGEIILQPNASDAFFSRIAIITEEGFVSRDISVLESFTIQLEYTVLRQINNLEVAFELFDKNNSKIFYSGTAKSKTNVRQIHEPGNYIANVVIPARFIAPGNYQITVAIHQPNTHLFDKHDAIIGCSIIETGSKDSIYINPDVGSVLVEFPWEITKANYDKRIGAD